MAYRRTHTDEPDRNISIEQTFGPSYPGAAMDATLEAARLADPIVERADGRAYAFVPEGFTLKDISDPNALPPHIQQRVTVDDADSLIAYANRFSDRRSVIIADLDSLKIGVELDWHSQNQGDGSLLQPGPCKHVATLVMRQSEEFKRWAAMENRLHDQAEFAEFLDENSSDIVDPAPSVFIEIARDLEATVGVNFKAGNRLENGDRSFRYETETRTKGDVVIPTRFKLEIPIFFGEEPTIIEAAFRFRPNPDGLKLGFVWRRVDFVRQAQFRQIAYRVAEETGLPVFQGRRG